MWLSIWHSLNHWFQFNYLPAGRPFYEGATWSNIFVVFLAAPLAWIWSKTKYYPLAPLNKGFENLEGNLEEKFEAIHARHKIHDEHLETVIQRLEDLHQRHESLHARLDHHDTALAAINEKLPDLDPDPESHPSPSG